MSAVVRTVFDGGYSCPTGQSSHYRVVLEQVFDQFVPAQPFTTNGVLVGEVISVTSKDDFGFKNSDFSTGSEPTGYDSQSGLNGTFTDGFWACTSLCANVQGAGKESDVLQAITYGGIGLHHQNTIKITCTSDTVDGK